MGVLMGDVFEVGGFTRQGRCDHLDNDGTQLNAYRHPGSRSSFCCLCGRGTRFAGHCNVTDPRSTKCEECEQDEYVDFEPHLERKCMRKMWQPCPSPKEYLKGANNESHRCVCPNGTIEDGDDCAVVPTLQTVTKKVLTTSLPISTESVQIGSTAPSSSRKATSLTSTPSTEIAKVIHLAPTTTAPMKNGFTVADTKGLEPDSGSLVPSPNNTDQLLTAGIVGAGIVMLIVLAIVAIRRRLVRNRKMGNDNKATNLSRESYLDQLNSREDIAHSSNTTISINMESSVENVGRNTSVITDRLIQEAYSTNDDNRLSERSQPQNYSPMTTTQHTPSTRCPKSTTNRQRAQGELEIARSPESTDRSQTYNACWDLPVPDHIEEKLERIHPDQYESFATTLADTMKDVCAHGDILPLFRRIVGTEKENDLKDIDREYRSSSACFYECMLLAIKVKGQALSPALLYRKICCCGYQQYTDIVSEQIDLFIKEDCKSS